MRKKIYNSIVMCIFMVTLSLSLAGCGRKKQDQEPVALAIVTLNGANMPSVSTDDIDGYVKEAAGADGSQVSVVIADGDTHLAGDTIRFGERISKNKPHWKKEFEERCGEVYTALSTEASSGQTDLIGGIDTACRQLHASGLKRQILVIIHSGITTTAPFAMQDYDLERIDVASVVEELDAMNAVSDLSQVQAVEWFYICDTQGKQQPLNSVQAKAVRQFWTLYFRQSGFEGEVEFHTNVPANGEVEGAPEVAVVETDEQVVSPARLPDKEEAVSLDNTIVSFAPDSYEVADEEEAKRGLSERAEGLCAAPEKAVVLAGSTADVPGSTAESSCAFGLKRAQKIKELLVSMGVDQEQVQVIGIGNIRTSIRSDVDEENRTVWLTDADSALAQEFRAAGVINS